MDKRDINLKAPGKKGASSKMNSPKDSTTSKNIADLAIEKSAEKEITLSDLVKELNQDLGYDTDRISRKLVELKEENKIKLIEKKPYLTLGSYILSPYSIWFWVIAVSTLISFDLIFVSAGFVIYLRYIFGGLLVLFLPGYTLVEALYAKRKELDDLTRIALSIGLSLALVPLTGLVLNYTPFGIRLIPVAVSLALITIIFLFLGVWRKHGYYKLAKGIL
ncbi:MAG TPA: DUF1616 domain-containing protein [Nitrososphaerales archaeon]|nr:DUF1616 domain-containing protein [Nitrososphaerales archaeon]